MTNPRYSTQSIERAVYDSTKSAKKVTIVGDITNAPDSAESGIHTLNGASQEIGSYAGTRSVGIQIISRSSSPVYINVGSAATGSEAYIEDNEGLFLPTNLSVYVWGTNLDTVVYWEL